MSLTDEWNSIRQGLERNNTAATIEVARLMFFYGAGRALRHAFRSPVAVVALAAELREIERATFPTADEARAECILQ